MYKCLHASSIKPVKTKFIRMKLFSKILSFLFHPMLMPTLGIFFILNSGNHHAFLPFEIKRLVYIIVFTSTCLLPVSLLPLFLQIKLIKSFEMETARERVYPALTSADCIENEDKRKPLTDDKLAKILQEKSYNIARRTVAKYREQLNIPVARLRKEW